MIAKKYLNSRNNSGAAMQPQPVPSPKKKIENRKETKTDEELQYCLARQVSETGEHSPGFFPALRRDWSHDKINGGGWLCKK